ncbi:MAG: hypothetical protein IK027_02935 [Deltaproteobacteria bacterium]|nr:hypothetical protein [Deltaproteobacteria bacterium]
MSEKWKTYLSEEYGQTARQLVHFNSKTSNSNAGLVGIRLTKESAIDLPYLSLRTLMTDGVAVPLDYAEGGAAVAGIVKQMYQILDGDPEAETAGLNEKETVRAGLKAAENTAYSIGTESVDHRLRQILVPKEDVPESYVAMTPLTSGGLCSLLFDNETGLVTRHNTSVRNTAEKLRQAQFGIGGSNPQNIGRLVRAMQRPLIVGTPQSSGTVREAFAFYYKGIAFNVHAPGPFREAVVKYANFRENVLLTPNPSQSGTNMQNREQEERLMAGIARAVLAAGEDVHELLSQYADVLPQNAPIPDTEPVEYALVAPNVTPVIRGLLDARLRNKDWPRAIAKFTVTQMLAADREGKRLFMLDSAARAHLESLLEEDFR